MAADVAAGEGGDVVDEPHPAGLRNELDAVFRADPHAAHTGIVIRDWGLGHAEVELVTEARHGNFIGPVHGSIAVAVADVALSIAGNSWGRVSLALSLEAQWTKATLVGQTMRGVARCRSRSRRISSFQIDVEADGRLVATFQALNYRTENWHFGPDRWPEDWRHRY